ncbi:Prophage PssSM-03, Orf18 [Pseudomonas coronafaciens pv. coronafaciens]|nr:Prophage PssSM-03, Orf18 [Pseudomonas coronafaciens pv. striafaciens]RMN95000.1 Prophage PssSM-03, Orf18 [Pseudomonas coronafaciens pv. coronafaciens]
MATGWLGWSPQVAWHTSLPELFLAMDAKIEWARMTSPFPSNTQSNTPSKPEPTTVAHKLRMALTGKGST